MSLPRKWRGMNYQRERYGRLVRLHQIFAMASITGTLPKGKRRIWNRIKAAIEVLEDYQIERRKRKADRKR